MSVTGQRTFADLQLECRKLNITVPKEFPQNRGGKCSKSDLIKLLQNYHLKHMGGPTRALELQLQLDTPMLASQFKDLSEDLQRGVWVSKDWYAEEKLDGVRMTAHFLKGEDKPSLFSRNISVKDFLPVNYSENVLMNYDPTQLEHEFIIDNELISLNPKVSTIIERRHGGVVTDTMLQAVTALLALDSKDSLIIQKDAPLQFKAFDILYWDGEWLLDKPYHERRKYLLLAIAELTKAGIDVSVPRSNYREKKAFADKIIKLGGEGVILKNLRATYFNTNSRSHRMWVKWKRTVGMSSGLAGFNDTIDAYISGFEAAKDDKGFQGLVGSLNVSINLRSADGTIKEHVLARISNIPLDLRKRMTITVDGQPALADEWYGRVVEIEGQDISARALRFTHARLIKFRDDRSADTCIMEEDFLKSLVL